MEVRLAVIGSGFGLYGLLPAFQQIPGCVITGVRVLKLVEIQ